jgi:hypothetical protein
MGGEEIVVRSDFLLIGELMQQSSELTLRHIVDVLSIEISCNQFPRASH